jgi:hypothetical protein
MPVMFTARTQRTALAAETPKRSAAARRDRPPATAVTSLDRRSVESGLTMHAGVLPGPHGESRVNGVGKALPIHTGQFPLKALMANPPATLIPASDRRPLSEGGRRSQQSMPCMQKPFHPAFLRAGASDGVRRRTLPGDLMGRHAPPPLHDARGATEHVLNRNARHALIGWDCNEKQKRWEAQPRSAIFL